MSIIENYKKACKDIAEHVGYEGNIENHIIDTEFINGFFSFFAENEEISWAENKEDVENQDGELYEAECKGVYRGEEFTLVLVSSDFGYDDYWIVFRTENEIK